MRGFAEFAAVCVVISAIVVTVAATVVSPAGRPIVLASGCLAFVVQLATFGAARLLQQRNFLLGWGLGSGLRLLALVVYGLVVARLWRAQIAPALLSFVTILFVTTVIEPLFLKR